MAKYPTLEEALDEIGSADRLLTAEYRRLTEVKGEIERLDRDRESANAAAMRIIRLAGLGKADAIEAEDGQLWSVSGGRLTPLVRISADDERFTQPSPEHSREPELRDMATVSIRSDEGDDHVPSRGRHATANLGDIEDAG